MKCPMTQTMNICQMIMMMIKCPTKDDNDSETVTDEMKPVDKMNSYE